MHPVSPFLFLLSLASVSAASLSVEEAAARTARDNPSLRAARWRIEEARGRLVQAGRLSNPELELDYKGVRRSREFAAGAALSQKFPLTARLSLERAVARAEFSAAESEVADSARRLVTEARVAAIKLLALQAQRALRQQQLTNSRELASFSNRRVQQGEASRVEASQAELEARQLAAETRRLDFEAATLAGELRVLTGLRRSEAVTITGSLESVQPTAGGTDPSQRADFRVA